MFPYGLALRILGAVAIIAAAVLWWEHLKTGWLAEGGRLARAECQASNDRAHAKRQEDIGGFALESQLREDELQKKLEATEAELERAKRERKSNVSPVADSRCAVPAGFVCDHDSDLSRATGHSSVSACGVEADRATGIPLSRISRDIGHNYGELGKCLARLNAFEERRYTACIEWDRKWGTQSHCTRAGAQQTPTNPETKAR